MLDRFAPAGGRASAAHSLRLRLPLVMSALIAMVLTSFLWGAFRQVESALLEAGGARAQGAADQLANLLSLQTRQRIGDIERAARSTAIEAYLRPPPGGRSADQLAEQRTAMKTAWCLSILLLSIATPALAQEEPRADDPPRIVLQPPPTPSRPAALLPLYTGAIGLQAYDGYSTLRGVRQGNAETNPLVIGLADRPVAFWTVKAVTTGLSILLTEQLWRDGHRTQAIVWMVVADGVMAAVAARNASLVHSAQ